LPQADAKHVLPAFLKDWTSCYGAPVKIFTDRGNVFIGRDWQDMLHYLGSTHFAANACSPWKNGHCERLNRSLKTALCAKRNLANWVISYPWSIFLLHTVHRQDFGASSAQMLYGMNLQLTNQFYPTHHDDSNSPASAAACLQYRMGAFHYTSTRFPSTRRHM